MGSSISPADYLRSRIGILESQISQIDEEIASRTEDHTTMMNALRDAKQTYVSSLLNPEALERLSLGTSFSERRQRMQQIIRGVNTRMFDEVRVYKSFLKSLNSERRQIEREAQLLRLRLQLTGEA